MPLRTAVERYRVIEEDMNGLTDRQYFEEIATIASDVNSVLSYVYL
jgi:hypothetical protein